ncbi:MAG: FmdB family zinc ribbon protein [Gammaproteobacteria bacterium]
MPIYEYECVHCGDRIEVLHRMGDPLKTECPACHTHSLRKLVSAGGFRLKGTGWYETDFKTQPKKTKEPQKESKEPAPKEAATQESKKETKTTGASTKSE